MKGRIPKQPSLLQRPKKVSTKAVLPAEGVKRRAPPLPKDCQWGEETRSWWRDVWHSPMAAEFVKSDFWGLYMLGDLINLFWAKPGPSLASEIRQQAGSFGLDPISRRRLQWSVQKLDAAQRKRVAAKPAADPRNVLRVVK